MCPLKYPPHLTLYPFQETSIKKAIQFLAQNESHACVLAHEQGLGKSAMSLVISNTIGSRRTLIIVPAIMRLVFVAEINVWCKDNQPSVCVIATSSDVDNSSSYDFVVCSYSLASNLHVLKELASQRFDLLILDECQNIKSKSAKRTRAVIKDIWPVCKNRILMSGTILTNSMLDTWIPFHNCLPKAFPVFSDFMERYSFHRLTPWGLTYYGVKNDKELSKIIRDNFYIRYKKCDVLQELPAKTYQKITLPASLSLKVLASSKPALDADIDHLLDALSSGRSIVIPPSLAAHRREQGLLKVQAVAEFAAELLEQGIPLVIFAHHKDVIAGLTTALSAYNPYVVVGDTPMKERMDMINKFQAGAGICFIGSLMACSTGITLTASCTVLLAEMDYSPANNDQAISRTHRISQKLPVTIYYFIVEKSLDEKIADIVIEKTKVFNKVID
jgi:SNF2 family DNA or RNA helicase